MSRQKDFRRRKRESRFRFLRTVGPFAVLAVIVGFAFLKFVPPTRAPIPVFYVGFDVSDDENAIMNANPLASIDKLKAQRNLWGGIEKNALLIFCDVVGRTGNANEVDDPLVPEVFIPENRDDYINALYDEPTTGDWKPFFEYLSEITDALAPSASANSPKYVIVALNVFHPDAPGGMPPQLNRFVKLVSDGWDSKFESPEHIDLSLFISHDFGQRNYQHSDPENIGSHFKRTLDLYLQGKGVELSQIEEITLAELTDPETGLVQAVTESAARHELLQTPVLLRKSLNDQVDVRLGSPEENPTVGKYFVYRTRSQSPRNVDDWWEQLRNRVNHRHWEVENPFDLQRANMLLLQYERRWYEGREPDANRGISRILNQILGLRQTANPPQHSLYDVSLNMARSNDLRFSPIDDRRFEIAWLRSSQADNARPTLEAWLSKGGSKHERKAFEIWRALSSAELLDRPTLQAATELFSNSEFDFETPANEIVFLRRLATELPSFDFPDTFMRAIRNAIKVRDLSNQFGANLNPVLMTKYSGDFGELENRRRVLEDRVFGLDLENAIELARSYAELAQEYGELVSDHDDELNAIKKLNRQLVEAPHAFRFAIEVLSNQQESEFDVNQIESYGEIWAAVSSGNALNSDTDVAKTRTTADRLAKAHDRLCVGDMDVYATTDIVIDNPADVATDVRNTSRRLLLYWPGEFRYGDQATTMASSRQSVREILNSSAVEDAGISSSRDAAASYQPLLELASNGFLSKNSSVDERQFVLPMIRQVNDSKTGQNSLNGWPLLSNAAKETHLSWPVRDSLGSDDSIYKRVIQSLNNFHFAKSDLMFERIRKDFCGTRVGDGRYLDKALSKHNEVISNDLRSLEIDEDARKEWRRASSTVVGDGLSDNPWERSRYDLMESAESAFSDANFNYWRNKDEHRSSNRDELYLDPEIEPTATFRKFVETQFYQGNQFWISIRSLIQGEVQSTIAEPYQFDGTQLSWRYRKFENNQPRERDLYLRGWRIEKELPDYIVRGESSSRQIVYTPKQTETPRLEVRYSASKKRKNIAFLIDCSLSMKGSRWKDVKRQLSGVFERLLQRGDINIELFAFGATKRVKTKPSGGKRVVDNLANGNIKYVLREDLTKWTKDGIQNRPIPRLTYPGDGGHDWDVIQYSGSNNLEELNEAIGELRPHGETPLFAALYHAIKSSQSSERDFFVVMTDGIDFVSGKRGDNGRAAAPGPDQPEYRWRELTDEIANLGRKKKTAEFNYDADPKNTKGNNESISLEKLSAFQNLVDESRLGDESLAEFLDRLFPYPLLTSEHRGSQQLFTPSTMNFEEQVQNVIVNNFQGASDRWKLHVKSTGKFGLNKPASWDSDVPLTGNEYLEFSYNPDGQLDLRSPKMGSGPKVNIQSTEVEFNKEMGSSTFLREFGIHATPAFNFWSTDGKLTPSPMFAYIYAKSPTGRSLLLQDYNEESSASNSRQMVFAKLDRTLLEKLGFGESTSLTLSLQENRQESDWHRLEFYDKNQKFKLFDKTQNQLLQLEKEDDLILESVVGNDGAYEIALRYDEIRGFREYTFSVSRTDSASDVPLDCWIIQVLGENGRRNNKVFRAMNQDLEPVERIYHFDPDQKLERIEHKFSFEDSLNRNFNEGQRGIFGIKKVDVNADATPGFARITSDDLE